MKKNVQLLLILMFFPIAISAAPPLWQQKISMEVKNESLDRTLKQLSGLSGYYILYKSEDVAHVKDVTLSLKDVTVEEALKKCLQGTGLTYEVDNRTILVFKDEGTGNGGSGQRPEHSPQEQSPITTQTGSIKGIVYDGNQKTPLPFVHVLLMPLERSAITNLEGEFEFLKMDEGRIHMTISMLGMETIDTTFTLRRGQNLELTFHMQTSSFRLESVTVTATESKAGQSTSSTISRTAMDHLQTLSVNGLLQLLPGGSTSNNYLTSTSLLNIRASGGTAQNYMNGIGTAVIMDGAPISNNADYRLINATRSGAIASLVGGMGATGGVDARQIPTDNIESVEIIRGIPGVEYGDLTSGAIIIRSKAGYEPLQIRMKANPLNYEANASRGFRLGEKRGNLNTSVNYAHGTSRMEESYVVYDRINARFLYSNVFGKLSTNTSFDYTLGKDTRKQNPDDLRNQLTSGATESTVRFNTNGRYRFDDLWLKHIDYALSADMTNQNSFRGSLLESAQATYTTSLTDGSVLSSLSGVEIYDTEGNKITNIPASERNILVRLLPAEYREYYEIHGRPINIFGKLSANISKQLTPNFTNRLLIGADFRSNGNLGNGLTYDLEFPPERYATVNGSSLRPRRPRDIPFVNQIGLYAEENILWTVANRDVIVSAGLRWDRVGHLSSLVPRVNASVELIPKMVFVRGGYGITTKAPIAIYLHPDNAYFDLANYNNLINTSVSEASRYLIMSTYIFDASNPDLEMATNKKREIGIDFKVGRLSLQTTLYSEEMHNGYRLAPDISTYKWIPYTTYAVVTGSTDPYQLRVSNTQNLFVYFSRPQNDVHALSKGFEFDLNIDRIKAIRTSFSFTGAYKIAEYWEDNTGNLYLQRDGTLATSNIQRNLGIGATNGYSDHTEVLRTSLRAVHNIPRIGFVVSLTAQITWITKDWREYKSDEFKLVQYMSYKDGKIYDFTEEMYQLAKAGLEPGATWSEFTPFFDGRLLPAQNLEIPLSYQPYMLMNIHLTKEIGDFFRISFFANNMFSQQYLRKNTRISGRTDQIGGRVFAGLDLRVILR